MNYYLDTEFLEGPQKTRYWTNPMVITGVSIYLIGVLCILMFGQILWAQLIAFSGAIIWFFQGSYTKATKPTIDLISIGIVAEDGREGHWISKDFNLKEAWNRWQPRTGQGDRNNLEPKEYWIRENVLKPIFDELAHKDYPSSPVTDFSYKSLKFLINKYGKSNEQIAEEVKEFIYSGYKTDDVEKWGKDLGPIELYGYYADYDHVVFCWLFGRMIDLPEGFPMYTRDLKQMLDEKIEAMPPRRYHKPDVDDSFEVKLEQLKSCEAYPKQSSEHSAIHDARWNKRFHEFIQKL